MPAASAASPGAVNEINNLLLRAWKDVQLNSAVWQILTILLALGLAWWVSRTLTKRAKEKAKNGTASALFFRRRIGYWAFPIVALLVVFMVRLVFRKSFPTYWLDLAVPLLVSWLFVRVGTSIAHIALRNHPWVIAFEHFFAVLVWCGMALYILGWAPELIETLEDIGFTVNKTEISLWQIIKGLALVCATVITALWGSGLLEQRLNRTDGIDPNVRLVLMRAIKAMLVTAAVLICLPLVGIDLTTLSVFGGALGVGLGFGFQKITASYISGFILLLDRSLTLGSLISVGEYRGIVTTISTRYTVLKGLNGVEAIVPNETLVNSVVINETFTDSKVVVHLPFQVSYKADLDQAMKILLEEGERHERVLMDPAPRPFLMSFDDNGVTLRLSVWIGDPREGTSAVISDINLAVWKRFKTVGIEFPYPQRDIHIVQDPDQPLLPISVNR